MKTLFQTVLFGLFFSLKGLGQAPVVRLVNPSFEGIPAAGSLPPGWFNGGFSDESPSDVQPGSFGCSKKPIHGETYVGMATRDNNTWERMAQKLEQPLLKDTLYRFSVCLSSSQMYLSRSRLTQKEANYVAPVRLRVWGGNFDANEEVILAESPVIAHADWIRYEFEIKPYQFDVNQIVLEVHYEDPQKATNGNLLIDNCSAFVPASLPPERIRLTHSVRKSLDDIDLYNPSFEDYSLAANLPLGWETDDQLKTSYRIHPAGFFSTYSSRNTAGYSIVVEQPTKMKPYDKNRFASLVASSDGRSQRISQQLEGVMKKDSAYSFSIYLAHSKRFKIKSKSDDYTDYPNPLRLRIWGGKAGESRKELLAETALVVSQKWKKFEFVLKPSEQDYDRLTFEACHATDFGAPYNGNILLDNCSDIKKITSDK